MVHVCAKVGENTLMRFRVTVRKLNVTDRQMDGQGAGGGGGGGGGVVISPVPGFGTAGDKKFNQCSVMCLGGTLLFFSRNQKLIRGVLILG